MAAEVFMFEKRLELVVCYGTAYISAAMDGPTSYAALDRPMVKKKLFLLSDIELPGD